MWGNAASLIAGGGAVYLNFDTGLMQNIIESLIRSAGSFTNLVGCEYTAALSPYERWVNFRSSFSLSEVQWGEFLLNWLNLANPSGHVNNAKC